MLKKRKYQKWAREEAEQEKVDLKEVEKPMPALKRVEKVRIQVRARYNALLKKSRGHRVSRRVLPILLWYACRYNRESVAFHWSCSSDTCDDRVTARYAIQHMIILV